jgi:hypothetical protein
MFTHCQVRWLFQYVYKVRHRLHVDEGFENATRAAAKVMIDKLSRNPKVHFEEILRDWRDLWEAQAVHSGATDLEIESSYKLGNYHLKDIFTRLHRVTIVGSGIPWESEWEALDYSVQGNIIGVARGKLDPTWPASKENLYVLELPTPGTRLNLRPTGLRLLHMARASLVQTATALLHKPNAIRTAVIHPSTGDIRLLESESPEHVMPLVGNVLNMMYYRLVAPNEGDHCATCPFQKVCRISHYNRRAISEPQLTKLRMEEELKCPDMKSS